MLNVDQLKAAQDWAEMNPQEPIAKYVRLLLAALEQAKAENARLLTANAASNNRLNEAYVKIGELTRAALATPPAPIPVDYAALNAFKVPYVGVSPDVPQAPYRDSAPVAHAHQWVAGPAPTTVGERQGFVCSACGLLKSEQV